MVSDGHQELQTPGTPSLPPPSALPAAPVQLLTPPSSSGSGPRPWGCPSCLSSSLVPYPIWQQILWLYLLNRSETRSRLPPLPTGTTASTLLLKLCSDQQPERTPSNKKSDRVSPLPDPLRGPVLTPHQSQSLTKPRLACGTSPGTLGPTPALTHWVPGQLAFWMPPELSRHVETSGPLHVLLPLPG